MAVHFHVLASGSSGNCCLLDLDGYGVLLDLGLGPRKLAGRLEATPRLWDRVRAALLTHVHGDHWKENTLKQFLKRRITLYCHTEHARSLRQWSGAFAALADAGQVSPYEIGMPFLLGAGCRCEPVALSHDGGVTCGFRIEGAHDLLGDCWALAYAADLGCWDGALAGRLADVDLLALEFNHDVAMQYESRRPDMLIRRVLSDQGHLSNVQAAALVTEVLRQSSPGRLRHLVQLHLSQECNLPELATRAAHQALQDAPSAVQVHTARPHAAGPRICLDGAVRRRRDAPRVRRRYQMASLFPDPGV